VHIKKLTEVTALEQFHPIKKGSVRALTTEHNTFQIDLNGSFTIVGERINPTGKKRLQKELRDGKFDIILQMAEEQTANGAGILDVNMGMNGIDEKERMLQAIERLTETVDVPLCIDSSHTSVIEAALRLYPGRGLINSISLEPEKMAKLLPAAKKYGAMFVLLPLSEASLPKNLDEKKQIIHKIRDEAKRIGLTEEDMIVDGLVTTVGTNKNAAKEVLETIRYCRNELNLATICGLSNISFGLPERTYVNSAFLTLAIEAGLTMAIANPSQELLKNAALAADMLLGKENADIAYIDEVVSVDIQASKSEPKRVDSNRESVTADERNRELSEITEAVVKGRKENVIRLVKESLDRGTLAGDIIDKELIPGINRVGELFQIKKYFLPQLSASAQTMEIAVDYLEPLLAKERPQNKKETIIMATVKGDIHDIGKNLVVLMLKNYGYQVIDLGKDVDSELIIDTAEKEKAEIIGLSALMTTTMTAMKEVVDLAKQRGLKSRIIVGGAVVTQSYADEIGADGYSKDASEAVKLVESLLKK
jgi:5-methyltetrahydrofolate--homocysteine methyltransferase